MSKATKSKQFMPRSATLALEQLGAELAVARLRRKESLRSWAERLHVSVPTLMRLEAGDPTVSVGIVATALWLMRRDGALGALANPIEDKGAIELSVQEAIELGVARAKDNSEAATRRVLEERRR